MSKYREQFEQVAQQIEKTTTKFGRVLSTREKIFDLSRRSPTSAGDTGAQFKWLKQSLVISGLNTTDYLAPNRGTIADQIDAGYEFERELIFSEDGSLVDTNLPQYSLVHYSIELYRDAPNTEVIAELQCIQGLRIEVNSIPIVDSAANPNDAERVLIPLTQGIYNKIDIFFYTTDSDTTRNYIYFKVNLKDKVAASRIPTIVNIATFSAGDGEFLDKIRLKWTYDQPDVVSDGDYIQIYHGQDHTVTGLLDVTMATGTTYVHTGLGQNEYHWYRIRCVHDHIYPGDMSPLNRGSTTSELRGFDIAFQPNSNIGDTTTTGFYSNETVYVDVSTQAILSNNPSAIVKDANNNTFACTLTNYYNDNARWRFSFQTNTMAEGTAWFIVSGYMFGSSPSDDDPEIIMASGSFVIDKTAPVLAFTIDADLDSSTVDDPLTGQREVGIFIDRDNTYDDTTNAVDGVVSDIYQIKLSNSSIFTGSEWMLFDSSQVYSWLLTAGAGTKTVHAKVRDKAGNESSVATDTIILVTGNIVSIDVDSITSYYNYIKISWTRPTSGSNYQYIEGYYIYRNTTGTTPNVDDNKYATIDDPSITTFTDFLVQPDTTYYYWIAAYGPPGMTSATVGSPQSAELLKTPAELDTAVSITVENNKIKATWQNSSNSNEDLRGYTHDIYRLHIHEGSFAWPPSSQAELFNLPVEFVTTVTASGAGETFTIYDVPPLSTGEYIYVSIARNKWGYADYPTFYNLPWLPGTSYGIVLNDGGPAKVQWDYSGIYGAPWGVHLAWYQVADDDLLGYKLYRASGDKSSYSSPTSDAELIATLNSEAITYNDMRDAMPDPQQCTYWIISYDQDFDSDYYSDPLVTGIDTPNMVPPIWVTGMCYAWYGYNHIVLSGYAAPEGTLGGYRIYRNTTNDSATASSIAFIQDQRDEGGINEYNDFDIEPNVDYYYWAKSVSRWGDESDFSAVLSGFGKPLPNYSSLFANYLDNGSFERDIVSVENTWSLGFSPEDDPYTPFGTKAVRVGKTSEATYRYIFIQPNEQYYLSLYVRPRAAGYSSNLGITITFYDAGRQNVVDTITHTFTRGVDFVDNSTTYTRVGYGPFSTANANAVSAELTISSDTIGTNNQIYIDAVQWEEYVAGESPRKFVDSRVISADRMMAHIIKGDMIEAGAIWAEHIGAEQISGGHIQAGTITFDKLASIPQNAVLDPADFFDLQSYGYHTAYIKYTTGKAYVGASGYDISKWRIEPGVAGLTVDGTERLLTAGDNENTYYMYYDSSYPNYITVTDTLSNAVDNGDFIIGKLNNHMDPPDDKGYFTFTQYAGPNVTIEGGQITAGTIHGDFIEANTISGDHIISNSIEARHLKIVGNNMLKDPLIKRYYLNDDGTISGSYITGDGFIDWNSYDDSGLTTYYEDRSYGYQLFSDTLIFASGSRPENTYIYTPYNVFVDPNKTYTVAMWLRYNTSDTYHRPKIVIKQYDQNGTYLSSIDISFAGTYSNNKWYMMKGTFGDSSNPMNGSTKYVRVFFYPDYYPSAYGQNMRAWFGQLAMVEGSDITSGYCAEGITLIDGGYIKTGTIDANLVRITAADVNVIIDSGGVKAVDTDDVGTRMYIDGLYYGSGERLYPYPKRLELVHERAGAMAEFPNGPFVRTPNLTVTPLNVETMTVLSEYEGYGVGICAWNKREYYINTYLYMPYDISVQITLYQPSHWDVVQTEFINIPQSLIDRIDDLAYGDTMSTSDYNTLYTNAYATIKDYTGFLNKGTFRFIYDYIKINKKSNVKFARATIICLLLTSSTLRVRAKITFSFLEFSTDGLERSPMFLHGMVPIGSPYKIITLLYVPDAQSVSLGSYVPEFLLYDVGMIGATINTRYTIIAEEV
jgi:hypothetical protein